MEACSCHHNREICDCKPADDLIDRLHNVKAGASDYFVIVEAVNEITALRTKLEELSDTVGIQRDDAWDEGFAHGYSRGEEEEKSAFKNGYDTGYTMGYSEGVKEALYDGMPRLDDRGDKLDGN